MRCKANYAADVKRIMPLHLDGVCGRRSQYSAIGPIIWTIYGACPERKFLIWSNMRRYYIYTQRGRVPKEVCMAKRPSSKAEALRRNGTLNPHPERVREHVFAQDGFFDAQDLLQVKYEMVRKKQVEGAAVTETAAAFGFSRPCVYQALDAFEREGLAGLLAARRGPKQARKLTGEVVLFMEKLIQEDASLTKRDWVGRVEERFKIRVHRRSIERALARQKKGVS